MTPHLKAAQAVSIEALHCSQAAQSLLLLGGTVEDVHSLLKLHPTLPAAKLLHVPINRFLAMYDRIYRYNFSLPCMTRY